MHKIVVITLIFLLTLLSYVLGWFKADRSARAQSVTVNTQYAMPPEFGGK